MPIASRRKTKQAKKNNKPFTLTNQHSSATVQLQTQSLFVSEKHSKMENGALHDTQKIEKEEESLSGDKEVAVEGSADDAYDYDEHVESCQVVEHAEEVSETIAEFCDDAIEANNQVEKTLDSETEELELKEEKREDFIYFEDNDEVEETELVTSKKNNEGLKETEVVETVKDMTVDEEENVLSSTDVVEKIVSSKGIEEQIDIQESSSYESAKESLRPSPNVHDSENNSVTEQDKIEESTSIENQGNIIPVTQRQQTSWKSCCGLFEIMRHCDR